MDKDKYLKVLDEKCVVKIKKVNLNNYCGYRNTEFDFTENGKIKNFCAFYGENGIGKSTCLNAVQLLCNAKRFQNIDFTNREERPILFKKITFSKEYLPGYEAFDKEDNRMIISGVFDVDGKEKVVEIDTHKGIINELPYKHTGHCFFIDADNPINMHSFQLESVNAETFIDMAKTVYGFECELNEPVEVFNKETEEMHEFHTDFLLHKKYSGTKVHYKSMSAGEKKIATLLAGLCNPNYIDNMDIISIDNLELHIYFERHMKLVSKLMKVFPDKQFLVTTHSGILVKELDSSMLYNINEYKRKDYEASLAD